MTAENSRFIVGIDLGTTNTAMSFVRPASLADDLPIDPELFEIPQLVQPASLLSRKTLPSFLYLAEGGEFPPGSLDLPWAVDRTYAVGTAARERGAEVPLRLVSSAKSWLSHHGVDRHAPILPFQAPEGSHRISPVTAEARILEHLRDAWNAEHEGDGARFEEQEIFLAVPASFDAVARELTLEAATEAGLREVTLLEEPQAAFYAWLSRMGDKWRSVLRAGDSVLVCDVGGGTTDFSLIRVSDDEGSLALERVAVGDHLLLGGDNMDLALAHHLSERLSKEGKKLDAGQHRALVLAARQAKEQLLSDATLESAPIVILGRGRKVIGGNIRTDLLRADLERLLLEGFFPKVSPDASPETTRRTGFMELGLPFASDPAITRHLAQFLRAHEKHGGRCLPTHVLFNGGVFNSPILQHRLLETLSGFRDRTDPPKVLEGADHDLAVSRGAAYNGAVRHGRGIRIRGGSAQSYYIGIETSAPAVPGIHPPIRALCIVPFGMEEGTDARVPGTELGLIVGEPVEFRILVSNTRKDDAVGTVLDEYTWPEYLVETAPMATTLSADVLAPGTVVPVRLEVKLTEIGTLEVWSVSTDGSKRWRLEFSVRENREGK